MANTQKLEDPDLYIKLIVEAHDALADGDCKKAIFLSQSLESQGFCNAEILRIRGIAHFKLNQYENSWDTFSRASSLNPHDEGLRATVGLMEEHACSLVLDGNSKKLSLNFVANFLAEYPDRGTSAKVSEMKIQGTKKDLCINRVSDLIVAGFQGFLIDRESSTIFRDSFTSRRQSNIGARELAWISPLETDSLIHLKEAVAPLCGLWSGNFFHWVNELLPRALVLHNNGFNGVYLTPNANHAFIRESLNLIGIQDSQIIPYPTRNGKFCGVLCDECWTTSPFICDDFYEDPSLILDLRSTLLAAVGFDEEKYKNRTRLYVKRSGIRKVHNEEPLLELLDQYQINSFQPEFRSFSDQIKQAAAADLIVGPHGSGLTLSLFMPKNSTIIELTAAGALNPCFRHIHRSLSHRHYTIPTIPNWQYLDLERVEPELRILGSALERELKFSS